MRGWWWCVAMLGLGACSFDARVGGGGGDVAPSSTSGVDTSTTQVPGTSDPPATATTDEPASTSTAPPSSTTTEGGEESSSSGSPDEPFELGPFGPPEAIDELNSSARDDDPTLRRDLLEIYFASTRGDGVTEAIYRSERATVDDGWDPPEPMLVFDTLDSETTPELSPDGRGIVFSIESFTVDLDLYASVRPSVDSLDWSEPVPVSSLNTDDGELALVLTQDQLTGFFCRRYFDGDTDIYRTTRPSVVGEWTLPEVVMPFGSGSYECNPWIDAAANTIVFATDRLSDDIDIAWAEANGEGFEMAAVIDAIASADEENDPWVSRDGGLIVFSRNFGDDQDLYWAERE